MTDNNSVSIRIAAVQARAGAGVVGKRLEELRTPCAVVDRAVFASNCAKMHSRAQEWGANFRAHLKTHKTVEGARLQLRSEAGETNAVVVSTLMEAWEVVQGGLVKDGTVKDMLYGLPIAMNKVADAAALREELSKHGAVMRLFVDHLSQIEFLEKFEATSANPQKWSVFVKVDRGDQRAGVVPTSEYFDILVKKAISSPAIDVYGFYCHAGSAYASVEFEQAASFLSSEVEAVNKAAGLALSIVGEKREFVLSVGSTPTAHAATPETRARLAAELHGKLELHAGNYPLLDLQQVHTSLVGHAQIAQKVLATVLSHYPGRGQGGQDEFICDAGALAMSKDTGPSGGFGDVIGKRWRLGKVSQEHGILQRHGESGDETLEIGSMIEIVGQHACLTLAAYAWYYIVDSGVEEGRRVVDVWVPWKGW